MKKHQKIFAAIFMAILIPCLTLLMSACGIDTTYVSPIVSVDKITTSDIEEATNKAVLSVVSIYTEGNTLTSSVFGSTTSQTVFSAGAGIIYKLDKDAGDAYLVTNYHVVYNKSYTTSNHIAKKIYAEIYGSEGTTATELSDGSVSITYGQQVIACEYVGGALNYDIAVLKISNSDVIKNSCVRAADIATNPAHLGETAIAIGNPLGIGISATKGIVSVESEYIQYSDFYDVVVRCLRTDAPINGGNSGGGLFDEKARLLGIVNAGINDAQNIGMAIPTNLAINVADNIIYNYEKSGYSGVKLYNLGLTTGIANNKAVYDEETKLTYMKEDIIVTESSGMALTSGLLVGDKVVSVQLGETKLELSREFELNEFFLKVRPGDTFKISVVRTTGIYTATVTASSLNYKSVA